MGSRLIKIASMFFVCILLIISSSTAQDIDHKRHIEVSLRMIAHQVLLSSGDSTSRVLPVIKENDRYRIQFESDFEFMPGELVSTIDRVVKETKLANRYILEVEKCQTAEMIYSFEMNETEKMDIIPCKGRSQPKSCYSLFFTLIEPGWIDSINLANSSSADTNQLIYIIIIGLIVLMIVVFFIMKRRSRKPEIDPNMIPLGAYHFDKRNTELLIDHQRIDLSGKESDLLLLLYNAVNTTVEREVILNMVWGDEGDYVGRTLDVFISKLRKKLEFDSKVKIVNIRGVGYKLVMDV
jgi:hypothetical protein